MHCSPGWICLPCRFRFRTCPLSLDPPGAQSRKGRSNPAPPQPAPWSRPPPVHLLPVQVPRGGVREVDVPPLPPREEGRVAFRVLGPGPRRVAQHPLPHGVRERLTNKYRSLNASEVGSRSPAWRGRIRTRGEWRGLKTGHQNIPHLFPFFMLAGEEPRPRSLAFACARRRRRRGRRRSALWGNGRSAPGPRVLQRQASVLFR